MGLSGSLSRSEGRRHFHVVAVAAVILLVARGSQNGIVRDGHGTLHVKGRGGVLDERHAKALGNAAVAAHERNGHAQVVAVLHAATQNNGFGGRSIAAPNAACRSGGCRRIAIVRERLVEGWRNELTDLVKGKLQVLSGRQVEDGQRANFLLGVIGQLAKELVAINESSTHGGNGDSGATRIENEAVLGGINLGLSQRVVAATGRGVGLRRCRHGRLGLGHGGGCLIVKGRQGGLGRDSAKVSERPDAVLCGKVSDRLCGLGTVGATSNELHLLDQLVAIAVEQRKLEKCEQIVSTNRIASKETK